MVMCMKIKKTKSIILLLLIISLITIAVTITSTARLPIERHIARLEGENAAVSVKVTADDLIRVTLVAGGQNYNVSGYPNDVFSIFINGTKVKGLPENWNVGEVILIGTNATCYVVNGNPFYPGEYTVKVIIMHTVIFDGSVNIT